MNKEQRKFKKVIKKRRQAEVKRKKSLASKERERLHSQKLLEHIRKHMKTKAKTS